MRNYFRREQFQKAEDISAGSAEGKVSLFEVDTSIGYEDTMLKMLGQPSGEQRTTFVITAKGSRIHALFSQSTGMKLYTMSSEVGYPTPSPNGDEVLLPRYDTATLLSVLDRILASASEPLGIVFDSVSDMIMFSGFESSYKFLKEVCEMMSGVNITAMFVIFAGAHDERVMATIRSLFASQFSVASGGVHAVR